MKNIDQAMDGSTATPCCELYETVFTRRRTTHDETGSRRMQPGEEKAND